MGVASWRGSTTDICPGRQKNFAPPLHIANSFTLARISADVADYCSWYRRMGGWGVL